MLICRTQTKQHTLRKIKQPEYIDYVCIILVALVDVAKTHAVGSWRPRKFVKYVVGHLRYNSFYNNQLFSTVQAAASTDQICKMQLILSVSSSS
jgi:hypothetical protein